MALTLGSLFDGIGVFPLAASKYGITPLWASEIEKVPISITKKHFPDMKHLGDITKLHGAEIPPVHIIWQTVSAKAYRPLLILLTLRLGLMPIIRMRGKIIIVQEKWNIP